jgi:hypothetical protein
LGHKDADRLLQQTLAEEEATDEALAALGEGGIIRRPWPREQAPRRRSNARLIERATRNHGRGPGEVDSAEGLRQRHYVCRLP